MQRLLFSFALVVASVAPGQADAAPHWTTSHDRVGCTIASDGTPPMVLSRTADGPMVSTLPTTATAANVGDHVVVHARDKVNLRRKLQDVALIDGTIVARAANTLTLRTSTPLSELYVWSDDLQVVNDRKAIVASMPEDGFGEAIGLLSRCLLSVVNTDPGSGRPAVTPPKLLPSLPGASYDYPPNALRAGAEGVTVAKLTVSATGRVSDCTVTQSSGNADLDGMTCRALIRNARFTPAQDANGAATQAQVEQRFNWRLPH